MISRRKFCFSITTMSAFVVAPWIAAFPTAAEAAQAETFVMTDKLLELEAFVKAQNGQFSWWAHNELRHHYLAVSERMSRKNSDILLQYSVMDGYVLHTLSDWWLDASFRGYDANAAIKVLLNNANQYREFPHLRAACTLKAGDVYREHGLNEEASKLYHAVLNMDALRLIDSLEPYRQLAQYRLGGYS